MNTNNSLKELAPHVAEIIINTGPQTFIFQVWQHDRSTQVGPLRITGIIEAFNILNNYHLHPPPLSASIQWCDDDAGHYNHIMVWNL
jgi:hypothetical protein